MATEQQIGDREGYPELGQILSCPRALRMALLQGYHLQLILPDGPGIIQSEWGVHWPDALERCSSLHVVGAHMVVGEPDSYPRNPYGRFYKVNHLQSVFGKERPTAAATFLDARDFRKKARIAFKRAEALGVNIDLRAEKLADGTFVLLAASNCTNRDEGWAEVDLILKN